MIRSELVARIVAQSPHLSTKKCQAVVNTILERISAALAAGDRVEIRDFGSFSVRQRGARLGRNPYSGAVVEVGAKSLVQFNPGKEMRVRLNQRKPEEPNEPRRRTSPAS